MKPQLCTISRLLNSTFNRTGKTSLLSLSLVIFAACSVSAHITGALAQGVSKTEILVGPTADFSGVQAAGVKEMTDPPKAYFEARRMPKR